MPQNWKTYKLGELAKLRKKNLKPSEFSDEKYIGLEHIGQGDFLLNGIGKASDATSNKSIFKKGDILYGKIRPYFQKVVRPDFSGICSTDILVIQTKDENKITQSFLHQIIKSNDFTQKATETSSGTKMPRADWKSLENLDYNLPPLPEQKAIANILSVIDAKIENNLAINKTLEEMGMALYKEWFVDFGPFQDGKFIESELGMIPEGWEVKRLDEVCEKIFSGGTPSTKNKEYWGGDIPWLSSGETREGFVIKTDKMITSLGLKSSSAKMAEVNDVVIASAGQGKTRGQTSLLFINTSINQSVLVLRANSKVILPETLYIDLAMRYEEFRMISDSYSTRGSLTKDLISNQIKLALSNIEIMDSFNDLIKPFFNKIRSNLFQNENLTQLRDTLLPKLISGEVRLKEFDLEAVLE
ncbi:MAG: restriction endonuclease subunit S [Cytophagaceae bacterium]|nr:restriction endonuclease subunit S [Cytophagaceae bacterium]|tara:strand:- start:12208 stop:13449 length:1242 start_codon:yes stop_codon:yes gene_type:complete